MGKLMFINIIRLFKFLPTTFLPTIFLLSMVLFSTVLCPAAAVADEPDAGEVRWRWIGLRQHDAQVCPQPATGSGWTTKALFVDTENVELRRFCLYERSDAGNAQPLHNLPLVELDQDVMGVGGQSSELATVSWQALETHFLSQAGQTILPDEPSSPVRLAVVDTSPTSIADGTVGPEDVTASSPHGTALLNMARDLVCDPTELSCLATVTARLAMAWECFDANNPGACRDAQNGGYVGLIGELAQAIQAEVVDWRQQPIGSRLVINLSLGWHQTLGGAESLVDDMPTPARAVYRALEDAVCRGALPIVAAGNRDASSTPQSGPFLPALWETRSAPTPDTCRRLGVQPVPNQQGTAPYRPLVFSVAGVEASGVPLDTTRQDGISPLAAFSDHAVVAFSDSDNPTSTLTGSSVAALVVSATAAAVWSYVPNANAFEVMASIYQDSVSLGRPADYCLEQSGACNNVRQVSFCPALAGACDRSGVCLPPVCSTATSLDLNAVDLGSFDGLQSEVDMDAIDDESGPLAVCDGESIWYDANDGLPRNPCPHRQYDGPLIQPWTEPQPDSIPCPNCLSTFASPGTLYLEIDDAWSGSLSSATLVCGDTSYALGLGRLEAGDQARLIHVPEDCLTAFPTFLSFVHRTDRAVLSPVQMCQDCR